MGRKKPGYDWTTNTYYYDDGGCGEMLGLLLFFGTIAYFVVKWLNEHAREIAIFGTGVVLFIILLVLAVTYSKRAERKLAEIKKQEKLRKQLYDFMEYWNEHNIKELRKVAELYSVVPQLHHDIRTSGLFFDQIVPDDTYGLLVYLNFPFNPPDIYGGYVSIQVETDEVLRLTHYTDLKDPFFIKVLPGQHVTAQYIGNKAGEQRVQEIELCDFALSWCMDKRSFSGGELFNYLPLNYMDQSKIDNLDARIKIGKLITVNLAPISEMRKIAGSEGDPRFSTLFKATIPTGYSTLLTFNRSDTGSFDLVKSGIILQICDGDQAVDYCYNTFRAEKLYKVTPGHELIISAAYEMDKTSTFNSLLFILLPDEIPSKIADKLLKYVSKAKEQEEYDSQIAELKQTIEENETKIKALKGSEKRKLRRSNKILNMKLEDLQKKRGKNIKLDKYINTSKMDFHLKNELTEFESTVISRE